MIASVLSRTPESAVFVGAGLLAVAAAFVGAPAPPLGVQLVILALGVAILGVPHGALDPWVARRLRLWRGPAGFAVFNLAYVALAAVVVGLWLLAPPVALIAFLAVSAWHFGGDWTLPGPARLLAGLAIVLLPAWRFEAEVAEIFAVLAGPGGARVAEIIAMAGPGVAFGLLGAGLYAARSSLRSGAELAVIGALALTVQPLIYFIVYFCLLHSPRHLRGQFAQAPRRLRTRLGVLALVYTALTLAMAGAAAWWLAGASIEQSALRIVFIGLAALTAPHMLLIARAEAADAAKAGR